MYIQREGASRRNSMVTISEKDKCCPNYMIFFFKLGVILCHTIHNYKFGDRVEDCVFQTFSDK
jgi:Tfp pilus assembly protein PilZ